MGLHFLIVMGLVTALAMTTGVSKRKTISFSGYEWTVRGAGRGGPGPNTWDERQVWVDEQGYLHLRLAPREGAWLCGEVTTTQRFGFGRYQFWIEGRVDRLDKNVVLGLFNYPTRDVGPGATNEIDIEFAQWGQSHLPIGNYTVWPVARELENASHSFPIDLDGDLSTQRFTWTPTSIFFQSLRGLRDDDQAEVMQWRYEPEDAPLHIAQQPMPVHMNLWAFRGRPPSDGQPVEVVVRAFRYTPLPAEDTKP